VVDRLRRQLAGPLALCVGLSACADPYADPGSRASAEEPPSTSAAVPVAVAAQASGDARPVEPAPGLLARVTPSAASSPAALARTYARGATNWDWRTLPDRLERMRERSAGALSAELTNAIRAARGGESLTRDHPASEGTVVAVSVQGAGASRRLVVVTRERETASGVEPLGPATHRVYLGTARQMADGWRMVEWRRAP
jgi:hypothetical protein